MTAVRFAVIVILAAIFIGYLKNRKLSDNPSMYDRKLDTEYDYIVIGSGSAGSVVAARLSEDKDTQVLLLEAGGHYTENEAIHVPILWPTLQKTKYDWQYYTEPQTHSFHGLNERRGFLPRGRVLGGTSCLNVMQYTRGSKYDFDEWAAAGCEGWSYKDVLPYFLKSEDINIDELKSSPYHSKGGPLSISFSSYKTQLAGIYLRAGVELGYSIADYNGEDQEGFSRIQTTIRNGVRSSTSLEYIDKAEFKENLHVSLESLATKIDISNKRAVGVYYIKNGKKHYIKCKKEIVVSAGAINSPQLLMLSGIGPKIHLNELGIVVKADLPVGQNFQDHQILALKTKINKPIGINRDDIGSLRNIINYKFFGDGPLSATGSEGSAFLRLDKTKRNQTHPDIQFTFFPVLFKDNVLNLQHEIAEEYLETTGNDGGFTIVINLTRPKSVGSITLRSTDPFDHPKIDTGFFTNEDDLDTMLGGIRIWEQLMNTKAFKELGANIEDNKFKFCSDHKFRSDDYWKCVTRTVSTTDYHHSGTCRMGARGNPTAVVDPQLRVIGIDGLRVADASVFPNVTSGNTNSPAIMVGEKAADMIMGRYTVEKYKRDM